MRCTECGLPITLIPSAIERAAKDIAGNPPSFYTKLFTIHAQCQIDKRNKGVSELMASQRKD